MLKGFLKFFYYGWIHFYCSLYDYVKSMFYSNMIIKRNSNKVALGSKIMINLHRVEKGLSLKNTKILFGKWFFPQLLKDLNKFEKKFGNQYPLNVSKACLAEYKEFNIENDIKDTEYPLNRIQDSDQQNSGTKIVNSSFTDIHKESDFFVLAENRSSIRNFKKKPSTDLVKKAVELAIHTPSVCNRQPWGVYYFNDKKKVEELLKFQNGNLGFRATIPALIIITGNLKEMEFPYERHQIYIDGGLFSMTLIYSLQSLEIGSCCLNWCSKPLNDLKTHRAANIPLDQEIIMFMAVGEYEKDIRVTKSPKKPISEVWHTNDIA